MRDAIIDSVVSSQQLAGVPVTREMAEQAFEDSLKRPLPDIGGRERIVVDSRRLLA